MTHDQLILTLCERVSRPSEFDLVLEAEDYVTDEQIKAEIHHIAVRLYHYDEGRNI